MPGSLDKNSDTALAGLFSLPAGTGGADTVEAHWSEALASEPSATRTLRLERASPPPPATRSKRLVRPGVPDADYEVGALLARGGGGRIFEGKQISTGRPVAIKRLPPEWATDTAMRTRFLREGLLAAGFNHPHLLAVYEVGVDQDGLPFIAMPRVEGVPWSRSIRERPRRDNLAILAKVADAVACLHSHGVVHRDIKPANVLLGPQGQVWLTDWGLAARLPDPGRGRGLPDDAASGGTPAYMAPEMAHDERPLIGFASDVYLLGAVLREILTGKPPHAAGGAAESLLLAAETSRPKPSGRGGLSTLVFQALKNEPSERPTLREFAASLRTASRPFVETRLPYILTALFGMAAAFLFWQTQTRRSASDQEAGSSAPVAEDKHRQQSRKTGEDAEKRIETIRERINAILPHAGSQARFIVDDESGELTGVVIGGVRLETLDFLEDCATLKQVAVRDAGIVSLEPLRGKSLTDLDVMGNNIADVSPLTDMPLQYLNIARNPVASLAPLRNARLKTLLVGGTNIEDLSPLRGMPIEEMDIGGRYLRGHPDDAYFGLRAPVHDLEPLRSAPLRYLRCEGFSADPDPPVQRKPLASLAFLEGNSTLKALSVAGNAIADLSPLAGIPLMYVDIADNLVQDIAPLANPSVDFVNCDNNRVLSIEPLHGQRLGVLLCDNNPITDFGAYISFPNLRAAWPGRENGLPENMPEKIMDEVRKKLLRPRNPPLPPDEVERPSHLGYYHLYTARRWR